MAKTRFTLQNGPKWQKHDFRQNSSKWQKRGLLSKIAQNGLLKIAQKGQTRGLLVKIAQNGKNAVYSSNWLKMAKTQLSRQNSSKWQKRDLFVKMAQNNKNADYSSK